MRVLLWEGDPDAAWQAASEGGCTRRPLAEAGYVEEVRTKHRAKRNLMKLMAALDPAHAA